LIQRNNAQNLNQIIGKRGVDSKHSQRRRYQPLSENYRGINNKLSLQDANKNIPTSQHQSTIIEKAGMRGGPSITPLSGRKEGLLGPRLKENYKNSDITNRGYYVPPRGLNKYARVNSQRSQPVLTGLKNNLARRYASNKYSIDNGQGRGLPPPGIVNYRRVDLNSAKKKYRMNNKHQYNLKPMSAKVPQWWG